MGTRASKISLVAVALEQPQQPNKKRVDEIIKEDRCVTLDAVTTKLGIGHNAVQEMSGSLGYGKICARWVPRLLTEDHKVQQKAITSEILRRYRNSPDLAPSDYHLISSVKNQMRGQHYETNNVLQTAVCQCLRADAMEFYHNGIFKLPERCEKCEQKNGDYVEK
jgi:predicted transcriptional regulator